MFGLLCSDSKVALDYDAVIFKFKSVITVVSPRR